MRTLALALTLVLSLSISVPARAAVDEPNAHRLTALGLFLGTGSVFDLGGTDTRLHGIIMLTRMLGEEDAALSFDGPCPFSDVSAAPPRWPIRGCGSAPRDGSGRRPCKFLPTDLLIESPGAQRRGFVIAAAQRRSSAL